ncbi:MAG: glutamate formimidoyltransferase [Methanomassiliicoccales archaeon]
MKLIECIPNFSEGRRAEVIDAIAKEIRDVQGVLFLGKEADADHNRCVLTFAGSPETVAEAAFRGCKKAMELIDLNKHRGEHPRIGATDVIPFVPISGVSMEECVALSRRVAKRIADELHIPTYLYERSATREERRNLANIRKGEFEGLRETIETEEWRPDFGEARIHPTAGATVVGARPMLIAFNVYLDTQDVGVAKRIAHRIRERDGGLPGVKALGFYIEARKMAQVSMNLTDLEKTTPLVAYEKVVNEAMKENVKVAGSEVVGMVPVSVLAEAAGRAMKLMDFNSEQILEKRLFELMLEE